MNKEYRLSRRSSLESLGALGVVTVLGGAGEPSPPPAKATGETGKGGQLVNPVELAVARFGKGHSCAQAVFSAFAEQMGIEYNTAVKLARRSVAEWAWEVSAAPSPERSWRLG